MPRRLITGRAGAAIAAVVALTLGLTACSGSESIPIDLPTQVPGEFPADTQAELEDAVSTVMTATGSSGAIVGVWAPWSGSWVAGLGTTTPGGAAVTADMSFRVGKITRAMTCDVMYKLAEEGTLRVDDDVSDYVGGVAGLTDVTLKELCDSTSGIGSYTDSKLLSMWLENPERSWDPLELASYGLGAAGESTPGTRYQDSDAGYLLLGLALERASGRGAAQLIQDYVAGPLALESTYLEEGVPASDAGLLTPMRSERVDGSFSCTELQDLSDLSGSTGFTDSGVVSTVGDLGRYAQALAAGSLMPSGTDRFDDTKEAFTNAPSWFTYGGGVYQAGTLVGTYGSTPGYLTGVFADRESGLTVVVVLNNSAADDRYGRWLSWQLAAIASKAPASAGGALPAAGLPWTADQDQDVIAENAICQPAE
ncbi:serine hydrolase [Microbacter sp. GSS18]|nr:serine hydrolase [Microbacter sp. GSS18]